MNTADIAELFIRAAEVERKLPPMGERPSQLKSQSLPFVHDTEDMNGWFPADRETDTPKMAALLKRIYNDRLVPGDRGRWHEQREAYWSPEHQKLKPEDVSGWEACMDLITMVGRDRDRRCLWAWAKSKAHHGMSFAKWCKNKEHISRGYGIECKNRALHEIVLTCKPLARNDNPLAGTLQDDTEIGHIADTIADHDTEAKQPTFWRADDAKPMEFDERYQDFSYYDMRRQRRGERPKKAA